MEHMIGKFVLITTSKRGVFAGVLEDHDVENKRVTLTECRMCVYWPASNRGVLGLAAHGPKPGAKITPSVPRSEIEYVDSLTECTDDAIEATATATAIPRRRPCL